jgi:hypothetical protein
MEELKRERERKRELLNQIAHLGEMRRGSVVEQYYEVRRGDGMVVKHGPYYLYSYKEKGKTISRRLKSAEEAERYRAEIEEFRQFEKLSSELLSVSQRICDLEAESDLGGSVLREKKFFRRLRKRGLGK